MGAIKGSRSSMALWAVYFVFVGAAFMLNWHPGLLDFGGGVGAARLVLILVWIGFTAFSLRCSARENLFRTIGVMNGLHWGRQIGIDLYISVFLSIALAYLVTGSWTAALLWAVAFIPFANLAILPFVILYLDRIVGAFT